MRRFDGQRITVMGLGRFGGGVGVARWLARQGALVTVTDLADADTLSEQVTQLQEFEIEFRLGGHEARDFERADLVIANPAVKKPWEDPFLSLARRSGVKITTEIALLVERLPTRGRIIGITGTAGKSTTASMIHRGLLGGMSGGHAHLGGNIGGTLLDTEIRAEDWVVLELSSAQLHWLKDWSPGIAIITNFTPNHLDWHGDVEHYRASKQRVLANQDHLDWAWLGPGAEEWPLRPGVASVPRLTPPDGLRCPGRHNAENAAIARSVCAAALGVDSRQSVRAITDFEGLPHRLQLIGEFGGVRWYDDSKCTTPEGCALAVESLQGERIHLIAGGYDKGVSLLPLIASTAYVHALYTIGETGSSLADDSRAECTIACGTLERAILEISNHAKAGDVALLSPGCASWDQFANYIERGRRFAARAREHFGAGV